MKVMYILDYFYPHIGGAEKMFFNLCKSLSENGIEVKVITSKTDKEDYRKINKNFHIYYFKWRKIFNHPIINLNDLKKFSGWPDIIHTATYTSALFAYKFAKSNKKKIILTVYEYIGKDWFLIEKNFFKAFLYYIFEYYVIHRNYDFFHAISSYTKSQLIKYKIRKKKIKLIYPIFNEERKNLIFNQKKFKIKLPNKYFLYYGRPGKTKGVFLLCEAYKNFLKVNKKISLLYVLSNYSINEKNNLISLIKKDKLQNFIYVLNSLKQDELLFLIKKAHSVVIPSLTEGFGFSAYESCLLKKKIIVSRSCSLPEVVFGDVLFFKRNDVNDLKNKLILAEKNKFTKIAAKKNKFDFKKNINEIINLYKRILKDQ